MCPTTLYLRSCVIKKISCILHVRIRSAHDTCSRIDRFHEGTRSSTFGACHAPRSNTFVPVVVTCFFSISPFSSCIQTMLAQLLPHVLPRSPVTCQHARPRFNATCDTRTGCCGCFPFASLPVSSLLFSSPNVAWVFVTYTYSTFCTYPHAHAGHIPKDTEPSSSASV